MGNVADAKRVFAHLSIMTRWMFASIFLALLFAISSGMTTGAQQSTNKQVTQVSAGHDTTCAVVDFWVKCWGSNSDGQLGIGRIDVKSSSAAVDVAKNKNPIAADPGVCSKKGWFGSCAKYSRQPAPAKPASALAGLNIEKVSVGKNHACALANARVYCWGDNSRGQLGNRTNNDASAPVAVDTLNKDVAAVYKNPNPCGGWFQPRCEPKLHEAAKSKSGLAQKEVMDIAAGEYFTCALASDGVVSCWGEGDHGRLGTGDTKDSNYPVEVYMKAAHTKTVTTEERKNWWSKPTKKTTTVNVPASALRDKFGVKLAQVSSSSMCVLAVPLDDDSENLEGNPYCWGYGMGDGNIPKGDGTSTVECGKSSPQSKPNGTSKTTYFDALKPVKIANSVLISDATGKDYITGLGKDGKVYYWGMHGHQELTEYRNITTCKVDPCRSAAETIQLAGYSSTSRSTTQRNSTGGTSRNTNHYSGRATPNTRAHAGSSINYGNGCNKADRTHYGYTKVHKFVEIGSLSTKPAPATSITSGVKALSGNVLSGLFCAAKDNATYCDANGASMNEGQTGSGYDQKCTTKIILFFFRSTTCDPAPNGPQKVTTSGWLSGKTIEQISTGTSGHTCALANNSIACWGVNNKGQLGTDDTKNRNTPTAVVGL